MAVAWLRKLACAGTEHPLRAAGARPESRSRVRAFAVLQQYQHDDGQGGNDVYNPDNGFKGFHNSLRGLRGIDDGGKRVIG